MLPGTGPPGTANEMPDLLTEQRVLDHHEDPGLPVLGTRSVGGGPKAELHQLLVDRLVGEVPTGTLAEDDVEERRRCGGRVPIDHGVRLPIGRFRRSVLANLLVCLAGGRGPVKQGGAPIIRVARDQPIGKARIPEGPGGTGPDRPLEGSSG